MQNLYVCLFDNGTLKVGRTISPQARISSHESRVACVGVKLVDHVVIECPNDVYSAESSLIQWCVDNCTTRNKSEWFFGIDFDKAVEQAKKSINEAPPDKKSINEAPPELDDGKQDKESNLFVQSMIDWINPFDFEKKKMMHCFSVARVMLNALNLYSSTEFDELLTNEKLGGLSEFELLAVIAWNSMDADHAAVLMHDVCSASGDIDQTSELIQRLRLHAKNQARQLFQD